MIYYSYYTDGACKTDARKGGLAFVKINTLTEEIKKTYAYSKSNTTNNRMELMAILCSLCDVGNEMKTNNESYEVNIISDSKYCIDSINKWFETWKKNNFYENHPKKEVKNLSLWKRYGNIMTILNSTNRIKIKFSWVKGHFEDKYNDMADKYAVMAKNSTTDGEVKVNGI